MRRRVPAFWLCGDGDSGIENWVYCCREVDVGSAFIVGVERSCRDPIWTMRGVTGADEPQLVKISFRQDRQGARSQLHDPSYAGANTGDGDSAFPSGSLQCHFEFHYAAGHEVASVAVVLKRTARKKPGHGGHGGRSHDKGRKPTHPARSEHADTRQRVIAWRHSAERCGVS